MEEAPKLPLAIDIVRRMMDAELLVYLVDEGKDIHIGVLDALVVTLLAGHCPAESLGYLVDAEPLTATPLSI
jgi:hypothetical protein